MSFYCDLLFDAILKQNCTLKQGNLTFLQFKNVAKVINWRFNLNLVVLEHQEYSRLLKLILRLALLNSPLLLEWPNNASFIAGVTCLNIWYSILLFSQFLNVVGSPRISFLNHPSPHQGLYFLFLQKQNFLPSFFTYSCYPCN